MFTLSVGFHLLVETSVAEKSKHTKLVDILCKLLRHLYIVVLRHPRASVSHIVHTTDNSFALVCAIFVDVLVVLGICMKCPSFYFERLLQIL